MAALDWLPRELICHAKPQVQVGTDSLSEFQPENRVGENGQLVTMEGLYPSLWTRISFPYYKSAEI